MNVNGAVAQEIAIEHEENVARTARVIHFAVSRLNLANSAARLTGKVTFQDKELPNLPHCLSQAEAVLQLLFSFLVLLNHAFLATQQFLTALGLQFFPFSGGELP